VSDIKHLDFDLFCNCRENRKVRGAMLFGIIPAKYELHPCDRLAGYFGISRCCGHNVYLCHEHKENNWCWLCPNCLQFSLSIECGLTIYPLHKGTS